MKLKPRASMMFGASVSIILGGFGNVVHGTDFVLGTVNAGALRRVVDDIDEVGEIFHEDGGRNGEAGHADVADFGGYDGGTDGAVGGRGVGFDEDLCFHSACGVCPGVDTPG